MRMNSESGDDLLPESFLEQQEKFKRQMQAVERLEAEFLAFLWQEQPASSTQLAERFDRHDSILEGTGGLDAGAVLFLFAKLEQRAFKEINKSLALAQTIDPERIAEQCPDLPRVIVENAKAVHVHAYTTMQSLQAKGAAKKKNLDNIKAKAAALADWANEGHKYSSMRAFARECFKRYGVTDFMTVYKWLLDSRKTKA